MFQSTFARISSLFYIAHAASQPAVCETILAQLSNVESFFPGISGRFFEALPMNGRFVRKVFQVILQKRPA